MPLSLSKEAAGIIGGLVSLNGALVWYLFKRLTQEVKDLGTKVDQARDERAKFVNKAKCRANVLRAHYRIDAVDKAQQGLSVRIARVETHLNLVPLEK